MEWHELRHFSHWVKSVQAASLSGTTSKLPETKFALDMMDSVHAELGTRPTLPEVDVTKSLLGSYSFRSSMDQFQHPTGPCTGYSHVLAKCLMTAGLKVRKVGLGQGAEKAKHHVLEVLLDNRWGILDASYNLSFRGDDGHLVGAKELHADWPSYRRQLPDTYPPHFDYSHYYYTNWERVPLLGSVVLSYPPLHQALESRKVSARFWVFNVYRWGAGLSLALALVSWGAALRLSKVSSP